MYIISTPIGNLEDISQRAILVLKEVDLIICENAKHSLKLLNNFGIKKKLVSLHDYNEIKVINKISNYYNNNKIALISDAGSPLISDPGFKLIKYFIDNNYFITVIPGPSSLICSLQLSGIPINKFSFYGFVPKQEIKRKQFFNDIKNNGLTSVFFVSANNLEKSLKSIFDLMGKRKIAICKEITKINEAIFRGWVDDIYNQLKEKMINLKGEFTVVLGRDEKDSKGRMIVDHKIQIELIKLLKKYSLTETVKIVHKLTCISKKNIYEMAIKLKND